MPGLVFEYQGRQTVFMEPAKTEVAREEQVIEAAEELVLTRRTLAISFNDIAEKMEVSRSLLYVYFDSVPAILDALFVKHAQEFEGRLAPCFSSEEGFRNKAIEASEQYLSYGIDAGPVLQLLLRETHLDSPLQGAGRAYFRKLLRRLATETSRELEIGGREAFVFLELVAAIPESLARMVREEQIDKRIASANCKRLVGAALDSFAPTASN